MHYFSAQCSERFLSFRTAVLQNCFNRKQPSTDAWHSGRFWHWEPLRTWYLRFGCRSIRCSTSNITAICRCFREAFAKKRLQRAPFEKNRSLYSRRSVYFREKVFRGSAIEIPDFQSFPFPYQFCTEKRMSRGTAPILRQPGNRLRRIKHKRLQNAPASMFYNAIDDLEDKLLRKLRNRARLMKTKRKEAYIGG